MSEETRATTPRVVISDFGGVLTTPLIEAFAAHQRASGIPTAALGEAMAAATESSGTHPLFELERGEITESEFLRRLEEHLGGRRLERFREIYFENLHPNVAMIDFLRSLRQRGHRLAMLTNNVREWEPLWRSKLPGIDELFELVVDSAFVGSRKPEEAIYRLTLERLGVAPNECVFIDDIDVNCEAARSLGIPSVHFRSTEQTVAEVEALLGTRT